MGERTQEPTPQEALEDIFEPVIGDMAEEVLQETTPISTEKQRLVHKRRQAEQRLEEKRLRDELGYYDLDLDDF